jgi:DNA-binding NarL/FixJ family response regulator
LILEDNRAFASALSDMVKYELKFQVAGVVDGGREALRLLRTTPLELLLLDLSLPDISGYEVLAAVRREHIARTIVVVSGLLSHESLEIAITLGVDAYVEKTAPLETLTAVIRNAREGKLMLSPQVCLVFAEMLRQRRRGRALSTEEIRLLRWQGAGMSAEELAQFFEADLNTIRQTQRRISRRYKLRDDHDHQAFAERIGLLSPRYSSDAANSNPDPKL